MSSRSEEKPAAASSEQTSISVAAPSLELAFTKYQVATNPAFPNRSEAEQQLCSETQRICLTALLLWQTEGESAVLDNIEDDPFEVLERTETGRVFSLVPYSVLKKAVEIKESIEEEEYFGMKKRLLAAKK